MTNKYRTDCVYYHVEQDMGAHVSCCCKETCFGYCPCTPDCKNYINVPELVHKYLSGAPTEVDNGIH